MIATLNRTSRNGKGSLPRVQPVGERLVVLRAMKAFALDHAGKFLVAVRSFNCASVEPSTVVGGPAHCD